MVPSTSKHATHLSWGLIPVSCLTTRLQHSCRHAPLVSTLPGTSEHAPPAGTATDHVQHACSRTCVKRPLVWLILSFPTLPCCVDLAPPVLRSVSAAPAPSSGLRSSTATSGPPPIVRAKSAAATAAGGGHATLADISSGRPLWQEGGGGGEGGRQGLQTRHTSSSLDSEDLPPEGE